MFSTLRNRFGIPGVISVIALVFAMFGGAYAASNSSGGGKATASAKAKKGPKGPKGATGPAGAAGPAGPAGPAGAKGDAGASGSNGAPGAAGAPGAGVTVSSVGIPGEEGKCVGVGGSKFTVGASKSYACNGAEGDQGLVGPKGEPWTAGGILPSSSTEKGEYIVASDTGAGVYEGYEFSAISFNVPLASGLDGEHAILVLRNATNPHCTGSAANPTAPSGYLCVYEAERRGVSGCEAFTFGFVPGANATGAVIGCDTKSLGGEGESEDKAFSVGAWATTG
jgi:hypothetical protein